ncbi:MAG: hypothetical protein ACE5JX_06820 [Acidobacteriota bacterium]
MSTATISLEINDASRQKRARVNGSAQSTVGELVNAVLTQMRLPEKDAEGHPIHYQARLEREGRHLHSSELVGDALLPEDKVTIQPDVNAG